MDEYTPDAFPRKTCSKCITEKPISEFYPHKGGRYGVASICRDCSRKIAREHMRTPEASARNRARKKTPEYQAYVHTYRRSESAKAVMKRYRQSEYGKAQAKAYRAQYEQSDRGKAAQKRYNQSDKGKAKARRVAAEMRRKHVEKARARDAVNTEVKAGRLLQAAAFKCAVCGEQAYEYHHRLGYGRKHWLDVEPRCRKHNRH